MAEHQLFDAATFVAPPPDRSRVRMVESTQGESHRSA